MAGRIAGITIEIGGDTTKLQQALSKTDGVLRNTQTALRDVNKLLKLDPKNTELLNQKQKDLQVTVQTTKERLEKLKQADEEASKTKGNYDAWKAKYQPIQEEIDKTVKKQAELKKKLEDMKEAGKVDTDAYKKLEAELKETEEKAKSLRKEAKAVSDEFGKPISPEQYEGLRREIIETEQELKKAEKAAKDFGSVGAQQVAAVGKKMEEVGGKISAFGNKMSSAGQALLPVTAGIVAVGTAAVKSWQEVDAAGDTIIKKTGATGEALQEMQGMMEEIATTIPTSFDVAGEAIGEVKTRFDLAGDALRDLSEDFIKFAELNGTDVTGSVDAVQKAMAAWGVETEDASLYLDALNSAAQKTGVGVLTIAGNAATNAAALKELGFTASDAAMFLGNLEKNGVDTSAVMTGLKKAYANAVKEGGSLSDQLADLETRLQNESTHADGAAEAMELFGTRAGGALAEAVSTGRLSFEELGTELQDFAGNVGNTFEATLDPLDEVKTSMNQLKATGADLVNAAGPLIQTALEKTNNVLKKLTSYIDKMDNKTKQQIVKIAAVTAAVGPLLIVGGKLITGVGNVITAGGKILQLAPKISAAINAVKTAGLALNPVMLAGTAAVGVVAAGLLAAKKVSDDYVNAKYGLSEAQKAENEALAQSAESYREAAAARQQTMNGIGEEYGYYQKLADELYTLTDANGKVLDGKEARAEFIVGTLNSALGLEISMVDGVIQANGDLQASIDQTIQKKKVEAMLLADQDSYADAIKGRSDAQTTYYQKVNETAEAYHKLTEAQVRYDNAVKNSDSKNNPFASIGNQAAALKELNTAQEAFDACAEAEKNAADQYYGFNAAIANHEALAEAAVSGENLNEAMLKLQYGFQTAGAASEEMLTTQLQGFASSYANMTDLAASGMADVSDAQLQEMATMVALSIAEAQKAGVDVGTALADALASMSPEAAAAVQALIAAAAPKDNSAAWKAQGTSDASAYNSAFSSQASTAKTGGAQIVQNSAAGAKSQTGEMKGAGTESGQAHADGLESTGGTNQSSGVYIAEEGRSGASSVDYYPTGYKSGSDYGLGVTAGLKSKLDEIKAASQTIADTITNTTNNTLEIQSPSKVARRTARFYGEGLIVEMKRMIPQVADTAAALASAMAVQAPAAMLDFPRYQAAAAESVQKIVVENQNRGTDAMQRILTNIYDRLERLDFYIDGDAWVAAVFDKMNDALGQEVRLQEMRI